MPQNIVSRLNRKNKMHINPKIDKKNSEIKMPLKFFAESIMSILLQLINSSAFSSCLPLSSSPCITYFLSPVV